MYYFISNKMNQIVLLTFDCFINNQSFLPLLHTTSLMYSHE